MVVDFAYGLDALVGVDVTRFKHELLPKLEQYVAGREAIAAVAEVRKAADAIQALHPGEVKASVLFLEGWADDLEARTVDVRAFTERWDPPPPGPKRVDGVIGA